MINSIVYMINSIVYMINFIVLRIISIVKENSTILFKWGWNGYLYYFHRNDEMPGTISVFIWRGVATTLASMVPTNDLKKRRISDQPEPRATLEFNQSENQKNLVKNLPKMKIKLETKIDVYSISNKNSKLKFLELQEKSVAFISFSNQTFTMLGSLSHQALQSWVLYPIKIYNVGFFIPSNFTVLDSLSHQTLQCWVL